MIFSTIQEFRELINISAGMDFDSLTPDIRRAERKYLIPYIGQAQYTELVTKYETGDEAEEWERLLAHAREVVACFTMHLYLPMAQVNISDVGVNLNHTDSQVTAFQWQIDQLDEGYFLKLGHAGIDSLLTMMDENKEDYPKWAQSVHYLTNKDAIINTYSEFNKHYYIQNSPTTYFALKNIMSKAETFEVVPVLGQAFYDRIIAEIKAVDISTEVKDLMRWLKPMTAHYTISRALREMSFAIDAKGAFVYNYKTQGVDKNNRERLQLNNQQLDRAKMCADDGCKYAALLTKYLKANATAELYTEYYEEFLLPAAAAAEQEESQNNPITIYGDGRICEESATKKRKFKGF
jgi:hypothetical protein